MNFTRNIYLSWNTWSIFIVFIFGYLIIGFINQTFILTEDFYYDYLYGQVEDSRLDELVSKTKNFSKFKIIWEPIAALLYVLGTAFCINLGLMHQDDKISFAEIFRITLVSYLIFIIPNFIRILYYIDKTEFSLSVFNNYSIGSLSFLLSEDDSYWIIYIFRTLNIFEFIYWFLLVAGVKTITGWDNDRSTRLVLISYGVGLLFWMTVHLYVTMVVFNKQ